MKQFMSVVAASLIGTVLGYNFSSIPTSVRAAAPPRIETKELVLLDDNGRPAARLSARNGGAVLQFYDGDGKTAVEIGAEVSGSLRFLRFLGSEGGLLAGLNSSPPLGGATLYLGDQRFQARIAVGALRSDVQPSMLGIDEWGIRIRRPGFVQPVFSVVTMPGISPDKWETGLRIMRGDGKFWAAPN